MDGFPGRFLAVLLLGCMLAAAVPATEPGTVLDFAFEGDPDTGEVWHANHYTEELQARLGPRFVGCILVLAGNRAGWQKVARQRQLLEDSLLNHADEFLGLTLVLGRAESMPKFEGYARLSAETASRLLDGRDFIMSLVDGRGRLLAETDRPLLHEAALRKWLAQGYPACPGTR